ncbi:MAG: hypothetical protein K2W92_08260 [Alphaproteobacteria bacterium]|nr:hypothetical protein [Alphaproteobacteria bacterium]
MIDKDYIQDMESNMEKYKNKLSKIDNFLNEYNAQDNNHLISENKSLKDTFKKGEEIFKKLKSSTEENYEEIHEAFAKSFEAIKEGFREFSTLLTMEQLYRTKDEIVDYGQEKIDEVEEYIKKHPALTAACALGIGFLVGTLLKIKK